MPSAIEKFHKGRSNLYKLERKFLHLRPAKDAGSNPRIDFGDVEALARLIAKHGILVPLEGTMDGNKFMVGHGERRLAAWDLAVRKGWLDPKSPEALIPVRSEGFTAASADRDRLIHHIILNEAKPLDQFEKGRAFDRMMKDHGMKEKQVAEEIGCTITAVRDALRLVNEAAPGVQDAVAHGKLSPTAAIDLVKETPDKDAQEEILRKGVEAAASAGKDKVTAKHLPIETGKQAQASRRRGSDPFAGKDSTPNAPVSNALGEYVGNVTSVQLDLGPCKVSATVLLAVVGGTYHIGWKITIPEQGKNGGFILVHPKVSGPTADTEKLALLFATQQIRAEVELKNFKTKQDALNGLDEILIPNATAKKTSAGGGSAPLANPVIKERDPIKELKEIIDAIPAGDAEKDRLKTSKQVLAFLKGKLEGKDLAKYILGISGRRNDL